MKTLNLSLTPEWRDKVWRDGGHYQRRGDFREISGGELPVILHQHNRHDRRAGDKVELVETGGMFLVDMTSTIGHIFKVEPEECRIMRLDLAADVEGTPVNWFRDNTEVRGKQSSGEWGYMSRDGRRAETLISGKKPNQLRIYDKTGHRAMLLASETRKMSRSERDYGMSFEDRWGYSKDQQVTRVERQIGGAGPKKFGFTQVGHLFEVDQCDPFQQIIFPDDVGTLRCPIPKRIRKFSPEQQLFAEWLRELVLKDGVRLAQNEVERRCNSRASFYRCWKRYREFTLPNGVECITRKGLLESFRASINHQLRRAA